MILKILRQNWLLIAVLVINTAVRFLPDGVLFPFGRAYLRFAGLFTGYWYDTFSKAAGRFLYPGYAYYFGDAVCWLLAALYVQQLATGFAQVLAIVFIGFTVNNLLDELIFDPYRFQWNEVVTALFFLYFAWREYKRVKAMG